MHNENHRVTWKEFGKRIDTHVNFTGRWGSRGEGRYWKRQLSKARRRAWKYGHEGALIKYGRICNWKNW